MRSSSSGKHKHKKEKKHKRHRSRSPRSTEYRSVGDDEEGIDLTGDNSHHRHKHKKHKQHRERHHKQAHEKESEQRSEVIAVPESDSDSKSFWAGHINICFLKKWGKCAAFYLGVSFPKKGDKF